MCYKVEMAGKAEYMKGRKFGRNDNAKHIKACTL